MPKKLATNSKAEEARERKAQQKKDQQARETKEKEDTFWQGAGDGQVSKAQMKRAQDEARRAEAAAKRAEAKKLQESEQADLERSLRKADPKANRVTITPKVTQVELARRKEEEKKAMREAAETSKRVVKEQDYEALVDVENLNRTEDVVDARSVEEALTQMALEGDALTDRHPEKRAKAAYKAFEDAELPQLRAEKPGMTLTQYKDLLWKQWKKSPLNPLNQP